MKKAILVLFLYLIVMDLLLETVDCKSVRNSNKKTKRSRSKSKNKKRTKGHDRNDFIDVGMGHPDGGLRRAFLRFLKDSLRKLERKDSDKGQVKLSVGVPLGLVTAYGIYADYCDVDAKHPLCNLPKVLAPKISAVTQRVFGANFFQRIRAFFN